jgi:hypothetical protein
MDTARVQQNLQKYLINTSLYMCKIKYRKKKKKTGMHNENTIDHL